jgi:hypothetical protein
MKNNLINSNIQLEKETKFVLIIGSGFHKEAHGANVSNCLIDWDHLLKSIGGNSSKSHCQNYILDFELLVADKTRQQTEKIASKIEVDLLKKLSKNIEKAQNIVVSKDDIKYPLEIFNPNKVSDVISLNFDLVPELLLNKGKIPRIHYCKHVFTKGEKKEPSNINITRHRIVGNKKNGAITFWHPHGDIMSPATMQLGIRKYGISIDEVELLRIRFKQFETSKSKNQNNYLESWYDKIINQPVIILGASMSDNEWDLWFAIVNKIRNFSKGESKKYESKIYKMICEGEEYRSDVFTELIPNSQDIKEQWRFVKELLG